MFYVESSIVIHGRTYRLLDVIGQGGEATVYRCEDKNGLRYAAKVFYFSRYPLSQAFHRINQFTKEAFILKYLSERSPCFLNLIDYEYKQSENIGCMILELGSGSLRQYLQGLPLNDKVRQEFWKQIVNILEALENANIGISIK